jgi:hypothetical protein
MANIFDDVNFDDFDNEPTEKKPKTTGNLFDDVDLDSLTGKPSDIEFQRPADKQAVKEQPPVTKEDDRPVFQKAVSDPAKDISTSINKGVVELTAGNALAMEELRDTKEEAAEARRRERAGSGSAGLITSATRSRWGQWLSQYAKMAGETPDKDTQDVLFETWLEYDKIGRVEMLNEYIASQPKLEARERNIFLKGAIGFAEFLPSMAASATVGGVGALGTTFAQIYGNKYVGYRDQGIDPEAANMGSLVSAALSAPIEYAGNIFQLGLIGRAAGKLGLNKVASGKVAKFLSKNGKTVKGIMAKSAGRLGLGMAGEGSEEVGQAYAEAFGDVIALMPDNPDMWVDAWERMINTPEFIANTKEAFKVGAVAGGMLGAPGQLAEGVLEIDQMKKDQVKEQTNAPATEENDVNVASAKETAPNQGYEVQNQGNGVLVLKQPVKDQQAEPITNKADDGVVHNILAGTEGVVPQDQDGISVSARTDITNEQAAEQLATNDARNHNYEQVVLDLGLTEKRGRIEALQNRHEEFNQQIDNALDQDDLEGAEALIRDAGTDIQELQDLYRNLPAEIQKRAELKNADPGATVSEAEFFTQKDVELKTQKLQAYNNQINNVRQERRAAVVQSVINSLDSATDAQLAEATVDQQIKFKQAGDTAASKLYENLALMQITKDNMGAEDFNRAGNFNKLLKMKMQLKEMRKDPNRTLDSIQTAVLSRQQEWVDQELINVRQQEYDDQYAELRKKEAEERLKVLQRQTGFDRPKAVQQTVPKETPAQQKAARVAAGTGRALPARDVSTQKAAQASKEQLSQRVKKATEQTRARQAAGAQAEVQSKRIEKKAPIDQAFIEKTKAEAARGRRTKAHFDRLAKQHGIDIEAETRKADEVKRQTGYEVEPAYREAAIGGTPLEAREAFLDHLKSGKSPHKFIHDKVKTMGIKLRFMDPRNKMDFESREVWDAVRSSNGLFVGRPDGKHEIIINTLSMKNRTLEQTDLTLAHEAIHGLVRTKLGDPKSKARKKLESQLREFWDGITAADKRAGSAISRRMRQLIFQINEDPGSIEEVVTYGFTDPEFAGWLSSIIVPGPKGKSTTLWAKLKDMILEFAGIAKSKLDELNDIMDQVLPENQDYRANRAKAKRQAVKDRAAQRHRMVADIVSELTSKAPGAAPTIVVQNRKELEEATGYSNLRGVNGLFDTRTGKVYIVSGEIDLMDVSRVWMHEQVGHSGLRSLFGNEERFDRFLDSVYTDIIEGTEYEDQMLDIADGYDLDVKSPSERREATEEWIAQRAQALEPKAKKNLLTKLRELFQAIFGKEIKLTEKDLDIIIGAARDRVFGETIKSNKPMVKRDGGRGTAMGTMLYWDFPAIIKAAGRKDPIKYLRENGWKGFDINEDGLKWFNTMVKKPNSWRIRHRMVIKARNDIASGKVREGTPAYDKLLEKFGSELQGITIRHTVPFLATNGKMYGPAKGTEKKETVTKEHILLGPMKITQLKDAKGRLVMDTPIFSTDQAERDKQIDGVIAKNKQWVNWYDKWNEFINEWPGLDTLTKDKYIKIMAVLSAGQGPQGNQEIFTVTVNKLEADGKVEGGSKQETGVGVSVDQADKINEIWEGRDFYPTVQDRQARYGNKVGAYMTAGLAPAHPGGIVIDRHMPRAWGYDITWTPNGDHKGFTVHPMVEAEIVNDISRAAARNNITPSGVQAAIWYETRTPDTQASEYSEAAQIDPSRFLPHVMHKQILTEEQFAMHYAKEALDIIQTNKLEDNTTNAYSQGDVQTRKDMSTEGNPYVPMGYFYSTLTAPETIVRSGRKPNVTKITGKVYDGKKDLLGYWAKAAELQKAQGGHIVNAFGNLLKKAGFTGAMVNAPGQTGEWFVMFADTPVTEARVKTTVRMSDAVQKVETLPQDLEKQAELSTTRSADTIKHIRETMKEYPELSAVRAVPTVAQFADATGAELEPGINLTLEGPVAAIKAWAARAVGMARYQNGVFIEHPEAEPNGTRVKFLVKKGTDLATLKAALEEWGIDNYNLNLSGSDIEIDNFIFDDMDVDGMELDTWENFAKEWAQPDHYKNEKYQAHMELVGSWDGYNESMQGYQKVLEQYHGTTKGRAQYEKGFIEGQNYTASISAGFTVSPTGETKTDPRKNRRVEQPEGARVRRSERTFRASIADLTFSNEREMDHEYLATNDETMSFVNRLWAMRDQSTLNVNRLIDDLEQDFLSKFGGKKAGVGGPFAGGQYTGNAETELLQKAMNLWIDSGKQLDKVKAYREKIGAQRKLSFKERERLEIIDRMLKLSPDEKAWASNNIKRYYDEIWAWANKHDLIQGHHDNYVRRAWNLPADWSVAAGAPAGTGGGFKLVSDRGKSRTLGSIIDGWNLDEDFDLKNHAAIPNLQEYMNELGTAMANRRFVNYGKSLVSTTGQGIFAENLSDAQARDLGYREMKYKGFGRIQPDGTRVRLFARRDVADILDKVTGANRSSLWDIPVVKWARRLNAGIKGTVLSVSLFHHFAGVRSWAFGVEKGAKWDPVKAYKSGLQRLMDKAAYESIGGVDYSHLGPVVDLLVRNGLTLGRTQDWEENVMKTQDGILESVLKRVMPHGHVMKGFQKAQRGRQKWTKSLFNRFFAGLKAEAGAMELQHAIEREQKKLGRGLTQQEINTQAENIARLINADFGGLHLQRMGRDMNLQGLAQLLLLAPDWTESNFRTVTGMIPGLNKWINKAIGDFPAPKGMDKVYRRFWFGIAMRLTMTQSLATMALFSVTEPRDDDDTLLNFYKKQFSSWDELRRLRWTGIPIGRLYELLGVDTTGKDPVLSWGGHFFDPLKVMSIDQLIKGKSSPLVRWIESGFTGSDWRDVPFQGVTDWLEAAQTGKIEGGALTKRSRFDDVTNFWNRMPAWMAYNLTGTLPIFAQETARYLMGEHDFLSSLAKAGGLHISNANGRSLGEIKYQQLREKVNKADRDLEQAKLSKDRKQITRARMKKRELNKMASRIGYTKAALRPLDKKIKRLKAKPELTEKDEAQLIELNRKRNNVFARFLKLMNKGGA